MQVISRLPWGLIASKSDNQPCSMCHEEGVFFSRSLPVQYSMQMEEWIKNDLTKMKKRDCMEKESPSVYYFMRSSLCNNYQIRGCCIEEKLYLSSSSSSPLSLWPTAFVDFIFSFFHTFMLNFFFAALQLLLAFGN